MEARAETDVLAGQNAVPLPWRREAGNWDVFMEMRDLTWQDTQGRTVNLTYTPPDRYGMAMPGGKPDQYTIIGRDLFLLPASDGPGRLILTYYGEIPPLGPKQPDNVVLLTAPDLYLYATLVESGPFTRGAAPVEMWTQYYSAARQKIEANERRARFTANLAMRPMRNI